MRKADWLFTREGGNVFSAPRVNTKNTHGTGCTVGGVGGVTAPASLTGETVANEAAWLSAAWRERTRWKWGRALVRYIISRIGGSILPTDLRKDKMEFQRMPNHRAN